MGLEELSAKGQKFLVQVLETNCEKWCWWVSGSGLGWSRALPQLGSPAQGAAVLRRKKADGGILEKRAVFSLDMAGGSSKGCRCCVTMGSEGWTLQGGWPFSYLLSIYYALGLGGYANTIAIHPTTWQNSVISHTFHVKKLRLSAINWPVLSHTADKRLCEDYGWVSQS